MITERGTFYCTNVTPEGNLSCVGYHMNFNMV